MSDHEITRHSQVVASSDQVSTDINHEAVILNLKDGTYYGLNPTGARIWSLAQKPVRVREIIAALVAEYDVTLELCQGQVISLLEGLQKKGLIEVSNEPAR